MRKLILMGLVVGISFGVRAAAIQWSTGSFNDGFKGPNGESLKSSTSYAAVCTVFKDSKGSEPLLSDKSEKGAINGSFTSTTSDSFDSDTVYYAQIVITGKDANENEWSRKTDIAELTTPSTGNAKPNFFTGSLMSVSGNHWGEWEQVPEPTSGMLLVLGLAGLALKRKRA